MFFDNAAFADLKRTAEETNRFDPNAPDVTPPENEGFFKNFVDAFRYQRASGNTSSAGDMFAEEIKKDYDALMAEERKAGLDLFMYDADAGTPMRVVSETERMKGAMFTDTFGRYYEELRARYPQAKARPFDDIRQAVAQKVENMRLETEVGSRGVLSKAGGFMGTMAGAMTDEVNLAASLIGAPPGASLGRVVLTEAAAGAASELVVQHQVRAFNESIGNPYGTEDQAKAVGYAAAGSVALPLIGRGIKSLRGYVKALAKEKGAALPVRASARAIDEKDFIDGTVPGGPRTEYGDPESLHEKKLNEAEARLKEETDALSDAYDRVKENPYGDPYEVLVAIRPEDVSETEIVRGETSWLNADGTRTSVNGAKGSGFGLVKFILYHGEKGNDKVKLTKQDIVDFPRIIRTYEANICPDGSREWVVQRSDGYKVLYTDKAWRNDGRRRVVSMYVLTERDLPLSKIKEPAQSSFNLAAVSRDTPDPLSLRNDLSEPVLKKNIASERQNVQPVFVDDYKIETRYEVVDLDELKTSDAADYPAELQPRDRSRQASADQVGEISRNLDPERLGRHTDADRGAPIVSNEGFVESGNGRTMAIRKAYEENPASAARYRAMVEAEAKKMGVDASGMSKPVLIRRRLTDLTPEERLSFVEAANRSTSLAYSVSEKAAIDAQRLDGDLLDLFEGGDLSAAKNAEFVRQFRKAAVAKEEVADFITSAGTLSRAGEERIQAALFAKAYGDRELAGLLFENESNIKSIGRAMMDAAAEFAKLKEDIRAGIVAPEYDITKTIIDAVNLVRRARAAGETVADAVNQLDLFAPDNARLTGVLKTFFRDENFKRPVSAEKTAEALKRYARAARNQRKDQLSMFDVSQTPDQILGEGFSKIKAEDALLSPNAKETVDFLNAKEAVEQVKIDAEIKTVKEEVGRIADTFDRSALEAGTDGADFADKLLNEATTCRI